MSDTPETDKAARHTIVGDATRYVVNREFAERLERQRDAYAETLRMLRVECHDFIDQRHPELAEKSNQ